MTDADEKKEYSFNKNYPRDLIGYAGKPPHAAWPDNARIAVQFVLNYEEGAENSVLHGDTGSEQFLSDIIGAASYPERHMSMESLYEYGSRAGFWRIHNEFQKRGLPLSVFGVAMALARHPEIVEAIKNADYDVVSHGWRWIHYQGMDAKTERQHMQQAVDTLTDLFGKAPTGWYTGRDSPNTRRLVVEQGGFTYDSDYYGDELPFWKTVNGKPHLIVPYSITHNDGKYAGWVGTSGQWFEFIKDGFDMLYGEGASHPKMMSVGLHMRMIGHPARAAGLARLLDYMMSKKDVWITRRIDIARHWVATHPYPGKGLNE